jgi:hypothetical protein
MAKIHRKHKPAYQPAQDDMAQRYFGAHPQEDPQDIEHDPRMGSGGSIHIKPSHKGKFTEYKKRTGKTTEEALHSKDPHVRQMANFARNAKKWHHGDGGFIIAADGTLVPGLPQPTPAAVTPQERQAYNNYRGALVSAPGRYVRNWDHNEDFQKEMAQKTGWDYSRNAAIQADMKDRSQAMPGSVNGIVGSDPWGGNPNWEGSRESNKSYTKYTYQQKDAKGNVYYSEDRGTEAIPQSQIGDFTARAHQSLGVQPVRDEYAGFGDPKSDVNYRAPGDVSGFGAPEQGTPADAPKGLAATGFPTREESIQGYQDRRARGEELPDNYFDDSDNSSYNMHGGDSEEYGDGGYINPFNKATGQPMRRLYKTPLPQKAYHPQMPTYAVGGTIYDTVASSLKRAYGGKIRRMDGLSGPNVVPGATSPNLDDPTGDNRYKDTLPDAQGNTPPEIKPEDPPTMIADDGDPSPDTPQQKPAQQAPKAPSVSHNEIGFSTNGLLNAAYSGADALVTNAITNPRIRAREAQLRKDLSNPVAGPTDFYGHGMGMYGDGGVTDEDYRSHPGDANALVESKEMIQTPDGNMFPVTGEEYHSDKPGGMGGKYMDLPPESRVFSKRKMLDKYTASAIMDKKITKKMAPAVAVKAFDTKNEESILASKFSDPIAISTADFIKGLKDSKKDMVFQAQEATKAPQMPNYAEFGGTMMAKFGGRIMGGGDEVDDNPLVDKKRLSGVAPQGNDDDQTMFAPNTQTPEQADDIRSMQRLGQPSYNNPLFAADHSSDYEDWIAAKNLDDMGQWAKDNPGPSSKAPSGPNAGSKAMSWLGKHGSQNLKDLPLYAPEMMATLNAMTDAPIWSQKYNPKYVRANELNVQADLNRNLSMGYAAQQRSFGNAGVDSGRRMASLATWSTLPIRLDRLRLTTTVVSASGLIIRMLVLRMMPTSAISLLQSKWLLRWQLERLIDSVHLRT